MNIHALVKIVYSTPNCSQLILSFTPSDEIDSMSVQDRRRFRSISMMNRIKEMTVKSTCPLKCIKLLGMLCPRLEHLTIRVLKKDLTFIIDYLLEQSNTSTCHLASLCIQSTDDIDLPKLISQLRVLKQSDEFAVQDIRKNICHIWWWTSMPLFTWRIDPCQDISQLFSTQDHREWLDFFMYLFDIWLDFFHWIISNERWVYHNWMSNLVHPQEPHGNSYLIWWSVKEKECDGFSSAMNYSFDENDRRSLVFIPPTSIR